MKIAGGRRSRGVGGRGEKRWVEEKRRRARRECVGVREEGLKRRSKGRRRLRSLPSEQNVLQVASS